jgi:hypothetical protein
MEAARAIGARYTVFVAKHCSGFLSWQPISSAAHLARRNGAGVDH